MHFVEAKGILSQSGGMNVYRGCSHGCIYCDSRSACYNMQHKFEDIEVKINAPELLENAQDVRFIESFGSTRSVNVGVAAGIAMYEYARQIIL